MDRYGLRLFFALAHHASSGRVGGLLIENWSPVLNLGLVVGELALTK